ncbi:MAG TPA: sigma-70 family RNA polymerase sigma factor [Candidatus Paceibacterota bacterium]|jgi:RNA polymerase sigma-70 factor (ECF subfamily)|nr:sigma-70 family RNA polymerase sigma factor [Candidatus Paceibacterota bacterium]
MAEDNLNQTEKGMSAARQDAALVQRALGSSEEFGRIIEKYQEPLRRYVRRIARPSADELDMLLQDIFIKAYENLNDFNLDLPFSSWIYRIAHNEAIDHIRRKRRTGTSLDDPAYDDETLTMADTIAADDDVLAEVDRDYIRRNIAAVLDRLEPKYRSVLVLKFLEDKDYNDISDILRKPPGTVATLIHRAKKEFKRLAEEGGMGLGS